MQKRYVTGKVYWADGSVAAGQLVIFDLEGGALAGSDFVLPKQIQAVTDHLGVFNVGLWCNEEGEPDTLWKVTFPTGETARFSLPYDAAPAELVSLLAQPVALYGVDDEEWERRKRAVALYSAYRPRLVPATVQLTPGVATITAPEGAIGVHYVGYGVEVPFEEIIAASTEVSDQAWCFLDGTLYLSPAPTSEGTLPVIWKIVHQGDERTREFPTIPVSDRHIVDLLIRAEEAEEQQAAVESGLSAYTVGSTTIKWAQQGGVSPSGTTRAQRLRQRAMAMLDEPLAMWG